MSRSPLSAVQAVLSAPTIAVVGVSSNEKKFGAVVYRELKQRGRKVLPVHPSRTNVDGEPCYTSVTALPPGVAAVVTVVPPAATEKVVEECIAKGITTIWMQQGSSSAGAIRTAEEAGMTVVHGQCLLMFLDPVGIPHKAHRFFAKVFGRLPR